MKQHSPIVLSFSGHDPSGGAGIQADIETLISHHCHSVSVITALTEQNTSNIQNVIPQQADDVLAQALTILEDMPVDVIKIGLIGSEQVASAIYAILESYPDIPVIFDPVLAAGGGKTVTDSRLTRFINQKLLPHTHILTPNFKEARLLTGLTIMKDCANALLDKGCKYVLITNADESPDPKRVSNTLFRPQEPLSTYYWDKLPYRYHGSGCTLSSSIAGLIAQGLDPLAAIDEAQHFTWNTLEKAYKTGKGQHNPKRLFWMTN
ncbi:MAG: hydroxymethylpyrimidine/phosphomethylpyrimidine kinase [Methylococcales bacterium]|nr:hydroxymethylpyrimidine/phosphomethylpyrimidine kinase [Methylococcales bacterium]MCK5925296.1 hydroxymethylpyrimidine/phosphomethylpyrimidine kinase [Methylococcales bacterium]